MNPARVVFPSKRDAWLTCVFLASILLAWAIPAAAFVCTPKEARQSLAVMMFLPSIAISTLMLLVIAKCNYILSSETLFIDMTIGARKIAIADIQQVVASRDPASGPAMSLDRLKITIASKGSRSEILISPADKQGFMSALASRDPALQAENGSLIRRSG